MYDERRVNEKFSLILKKLSKREIQERGLSSKAVGICGYGQNDELGPFLLQGHIEVFSKHKLKEKQMATHNMKRLKFAKFELRKKYETQILEELVEERREEREERAKRERRAAES